MDNQKKSIEEELAQLRDAIERLRHTLDIVIENCNCSLNSGLILKLSKELDELMNLYIRLQKQCNSKDIV